MLAHELGEFFELGAEDGGRAAVGDRQAEILVKDQHAGGQVGEDVLQARFGCFQRRAIRLDDAARLLELAGHRIERFGQHAELVSARDRRGPREVAARDRLHRLGKRSERFGEKF